MADLLNNTKGKLAEGQSPLSQLTVSNSKIKVTQPKPIPQPPAPQATSLPPAVEPQQPQQPLQLTLPSEKIGINQITIPDVGFSAPRSEQQEYVRPTAPTPQNLSDTIVTPGIEARQAEREAFNQRQDELVNSITQQEFQPNLYEPPALENTLAWGAQARSNIFQRAAAQDANNAALQIMARATQLENAGSTSDGLDWVRGILGQRDPGNERSYLSPITFNKATQEYETNILGAVLYPLGVVQNLAFGATLDVRQIMRHIGNAMPPWWRNFQSQWLQKNYPGIANSPMVQFVTKPNKYDDGKVNIIEALRGAQYSFSDDANTGVGIATQWGATKLDVPMSPGWKVPFNPTKLLGFGMDVALGIKLDKLVSVGAKAFGIGAKAAPVVKDVVDTGRQASRAAAEASAPVAARAKAVATTYEQGVLPLMQRPSAALPKVKVVESKLPAGFNKANKRLLKQKAEQVLNKSRNEGTQLSLGGEYDKLMADMHRQAQKRATPQDWRRYQYQRELPGKKFPTLSVLDPEVLTKRRTVPQHIIDASRPIPKLDPSVMQLFDPSKAAKRESLADIGKRVSERIAAEKAWAAELAQNPQAYAEYISRRADGQLELPFKVAKTKPEPVPKAAKKGTFVVGAEKTRQLSMLNDLKKAVPGEVVEAAKHAKPAKVVEVVSAKTGKNVAVPARSIELYKRQQEILKAGKQLDVLSESIPPIPPTAAAVDTTKRVKQVKQAVPKLPASPINDVVNAVAEGKAVKAVAAQVEEAAQQADTLIDSTQDIGRRLVNPEKLADPTPPPVAFDATKLPLAKDFADETAYHGSRVQDLVLENADPVVGSARHELGTGHYFFKGPNGQADAFLGGGKTSDNLPPLDSRVFGEAINLHEVGLTGKVLNAKKPSQELTSIFTSVAPEVPFGGGPKSLVQLMDDVSSNLDEEAALTLQRKIAKLLRENGVSHAVADDVVVTFDPAAIKTKSVMQDIAGEALTPEETIAIRNQLESKVADATGSEFNKATTADSAAQLSAQSQDSVKQSIIEAEQNIQAAVAKSGLLDDLPPVEPPPATLPDMTEVLERITPNSVGGDVEQYALDLLAGKLRPSNTKEFRDLVAGLLDDTLDLPSESIQRVVKLLEGKHTKLYDRVADAIFETKYADILPPSVAPVANKLDDLMKEASKYGAEVPEDLKTQIDELVGAIDDEAFERGFDDALENTKAKGGKTGEDISPCGL